METFSSMPTLQQNRIKSPMPSSKNQTAQKRITSGGPTSAQKSRNMNAKENYKSADTQMPLSVSKASTSNYMEKQSSNPKKMSGIMGKLKEKNMIKKPSSVM